MKKTQIEIGERFGKLTVIGFEPSDAHGNQYVRVKCSCQKDTEKRMRATALTMEPYEDRNGKWRLPHRSCGCESKRAYQEYWEKRARGIRKLVRQKIWRHCQDGTRIDRIAVKFNLPVPLIFAIARVYNADRLRRRARPFRGAPRDPVRCEVPDSEDLPF